VFALKWEGVDLAVLAALFKSVPAGDIAAIVRATPTGGFARRIWFLYEWLTGRELDVEAPGKVRMVTVVDPVMQVAAERATPSSRHRVADNLPGTPRFCPMSGGPLSNRAREQEFAALTGAEAERIEALYTRWFDRSESDGPR
jgi:hypothetical protein